MEERSFQDFVTEVSKRRGIKPKKIRQSFGVYDAYKKIRKNKWYDIGKPVTEKEFYAIIRGVNKLLAEEIANGKDVTFPSKMGKLELKKRQKGVSLVDGKLRVTYPINWAETLNLWFEDEEARRNKTLLRDEQEYVYHVKYDNFDATYENKSFYQFTLNRFIKLALKENIKNGKIDTLW